VHGPSARTWPFFTFALLDQNLLVDAGRGVRAHELANRVDMDAGTGVGLDLLLALGKLAVLGDDDGVAVDGGNLARFLGNEHRAGIAATRSSRPVATKGASVTSKGTAWRCMFEPISARFASSCSRNGIRPAATETSCLGDTSM
jgi:hypothetical protein